MSTELARQLQKLRQSQPLSIGEVRTYSILFDANQAASIDTSTIYNLAMEGFQALSQMDGRFISFKNDLFHENTKDIARELQTKEANAKISEKIANFLYLISPYFLIRASHKVLEYLIRKYRINEFDVDSVMSCILPFHETNIFTRFVQILKLEKSKNHKWDFLQRIQKTGAPLDQSTLVERCCTDPSVLVFICELTSQNVKLNKNFKTCISFYGVTVTQVLGRYSGDIGNLLTQILPYVQKGLASNSTDYQTASYMIISQLAAKTPLARHVLQTLIESIAKQAKEGSFTDSLLCIIFLCQTQNIEVFPIEAIKHLANFSEFIPTILEFQSRRYDTHKFLLYILMTLVKSIDSPSELKLLTDIIEMVPVRQNIEFVVSELINQYQKSKKHHSKVGIILHSIQSRYVYELDKALNNQMKSRTGTDCDDLLQFVSLTFHGSKFEPIKESQTTLFLSLEHPEPHIRLIALQKLEDIVADFNDEFVQNVIVKSLNDRDEAILLQILSSDLVMHVEASSLFKSLTSILDDDRVKEEIKVKALSKLAGNFLKRYDTYFYDILPYLARNFMADSYGLIHKTTFHLANHSQHPLFEDFDSLESQLQDNVDSTKFIKRMFAILTRNIEKNYSLISPLSKLTKRKDCFYFAILVLTACLDLKTIDTESVLLICENLVEALQPLLGDLFGKRKIQKLKHKGEEISNNGLPSDELLASFLKKSAPKAQIPLIFFVLHRILQALPLETISLLQDSESNSRLVDVIVKLYVAFTGGNLADIYEGHLKHLMKRHISCNIPQFLAYFWISPEKNFSARVQIRSIQLLKQFICGMEEANFDFQILIPSLLIALTSHIKGVRSEALNCLKIMNQQSRDGQRIIWGSTKQTHLYSNNFPVQLHTLSDNLSRKFLQALLNWKEEFLTDEHSLRLFLEQLLSAQDNMEESFQFTEEELASVMAFLTTHTISFYSKESQLKMLSAIKNIDFSSQKFIQTFYYLKRLLGFQSESSEVNFPERNSTSFKIGEVLLYQFNVKNLEQLNIAMNPYWNFYVNILSHPPKESENPEDSIVVAKLTLLDNVIKPFFDGLSKEKQHTLFNQIFALLLDGGTPIKEKCQQIIQSITFDSSFLAEHLVLPSYSKEKFNNKRQKQDNIQEPIKLSEFIALNTGLEIIQYKNTIEQEHNLLQPLFNLLSLLVEGEHNLGDDIDYTVQLILNAITTLFKRVRILRSEDKFSQKELKQVEQQCNVETLIQCLRSSSSPQIHTCCILALSSVGPLFPKKLLQHIMSMFSFMGTSTLSQDDNYTFRVIKQAIEEIFPPLIKEGMGVAPLMKLFIDSFENIPQHRRLILYCIFVKTVKVQHLHWMLLAFLYKHAKGILNTQKEENQLERKDDFDIISFCHSLCHEFSVEKVVDELASLLEIILSYGKKVQDSTFFEASKASSPELRLLLHTVLEFITDHLTSKPFLEQILQLSAKQSKELGANHLKIFELLLLAQQQAIEKKSNAVSAEKKIWSAIIRTIPLAIDNLYELLPHHTFVTAITKIIQNPNPQMRHRALVVLNERLSEEEVESDVVHYIEMLNFLGKILSKKDPQEHEDLDSNKQSALLTIEILARNFGKNQPAEFLKLVPAISSGISSKNAQIISSSVICLATLCAELGAQIISHLPTFFPQFTKVLQSSLEDISVATEEEQRGNKKANFLLQQSLLSSLEVMISHISQFLSPYLFHIITGITHPNIINSKVEKITTKVKNILKLMAKLIQARQLIPAIMTAYKPIMQHPIIEPLLLLLQLLGDVCEKMEYNTVVAQHLRLYKFFLILFDFRNQVKSIRSKNKQDVKEEEIAVVEKATISSFLSLLMKLNENLFKPLFLKIVDWMQEGTNKNERDLYRTAFFYQVVDEITDNLKSIFVPYYGYLLDDCIQLLNEYSFLVTPETDEEMKKQSSVLTYVLSSLSKCFLYDNEEFIDQEKFEKLLQPIVDQLENLQGGNPAALDEYEHRVKHALIPCLSQLAVCVGNDTLWKPLNHQVLMKTRNESPKVRFAALKVIQECWTKLGEEFLVLLPETIPFLSELMEDSSPQVEKLTQEVIQNIEKYLGAEDSIKNYL